MNWLTLHVAFLCKLYFIFYFFSRYCISSSQTYEFFAPEMCVRDELLSSKRDSITSLKAEVKVEASQRPQVQETSSSPFDPLKTDIWAMGVTFFAVLTGKLPFFCGDSEQYVHCILFVCKLDERCCFTSFFTHSCSYFSFSPLSFYLLSVSGLVTQIYNSLRKFPRHLFLSRQLVSKFLPSLEI